MVDFPLPITTEILLDGTWVDISGDVRDSDPVSIKRGRSDEAGTADPSKLQLKLNNRDGVYSPRNPNSPHYGILRRNTPIRVRLGEVPEAPDPVVTDTFGRTVTGGWGSADTGQTWTLAGGSASDLSVGSGVGSINLPSVNTETGVITNGAVPLEDLDLTARIRIDTAPVGEAYDGVLFRMYVRFTGGLGIFGEVEVGTDTGRPDGGLRVSTRIQTDDAGAIAPQDVVPGVAAAVDEWLWVRLQARGPEVRMRVWPDGAEEPSVWHAQGYTDTRTGAGHIALSGVVRADDTPLPVTLDVDDLAVREPTAADTATRYVGEVSAWPPRWDTSGNEAWVPLKASGVMRRLGQGRRVLGSALAESLPAHHPLAYWPMEDGETTTTRAASGLEDGQPLRVHGLTFAEVDGPLGSAPLPVVTAANAALVSPAIAMRSTGVWEVDLLFYLVDDDFPADADQEMLVVASSGTAARWRVAIGTSTTSSARLVAVEALDEDGTQLDSGVVDIDAVATAFTDAWRQLRINVRDNGSGGVFWTLFWVDETGSGVGTTGTFSGSPGTATQVSASFASSLSEGDGLAIGHLSVWGAPTTRGYFDTVTGLAGETARTRLVRLAAQRGVASTVTGRADTRLGPQPNERFLSMLQECEAAELGALTEQRSGLGLAYRGRDTLYNQEPALTLDYEAGEVTPPVDPTDDDQQSRNDVTAKRGRGSSARVVDEDGPMGVEAIGRYDTSVTVNVESDTQLEDQAGWRLHLGTINELRVPTITLNLRNPRMKAHHANIMALDAGDRIQVRNPPEWVGAGVLDLIVQGYEERLSLYAWTMALTCTPASAWTVGEVPPAQTVTEGFEDDSYAVTITDGGDAAWFRTDAQAAEGAWSLRSGAITDSQTTDAVVTVPADAETLSFWYRVSSEQGFDFFRVLVDSVVEVEDSGETGWTAAELDVEGASTVTFRYVKDSSVSEGDDSAWIDALEFTLATLRQEPDQPDRADTDGSALVSGVDADTTVMNVVSTDGPEWVNSTDAPDEFPFDIALGGEIVRVQAVANGTIDEFSRTETDTWGTADAGHTWTETGGDPTDRAVTGGTGDITLQTSPSAVRFQRVGGDAADVEVLIAVSVDQVASGGPFYPGVLLRWVSDSEFYRVRLALETDGTVGLQALRVSSGAVVADVGITYSAGGVLWLRARVDGHTLRGRAWNDGDAEPSGWQIEHTVSSGTIATGQVGVVASASGSNTNTDPVLSFHSVALPESQTATVQRSVNGVEKSHRFGTAVALAVTPVAAL